MRRSCYQATHTQCKRVHSLILTSPPLRFCNASAPFKAPFSSPRAAFISAPNATPTGLRPPSTLARASSAMSSTPPSAQTWATRSRKRSSRGSAVIADCKCCNASCNSARLPPSSPSTTALRISPTATASCAVPLSDPTAASAALVVA
eukprot:3751274-Rhodomonas_salina.1